MFTLRADQAALSARIEAALAAGRRPYAVAPTGAGKTVLIAESARLVARYLRGVLPLVADVKVARALAAPPKVSGLCPALPRAVVVVVVTLPW